MRPSTRVRGRFARSIRLDSAGSQELDGYLPTARALDVVRRVVRGMTDETGTRAFSITGPYGSGKSSLAVFLDALCSSQSATAYEKAITLLEEHDPETARSLPVAREAMGVPKSGMARAVVTAPQREPVAATVLRALSNATATYRSTKDVRERVTGALTRALDDKLATPSYHEIRQLIGEITAKRPLLMVIDEFGKNLEAYGESGADGDMYLLQELAEWASAGGGSIPMVLVTIQHLAFEAYAASASVSKRREWAKVQGRFEDVPYVDSAAATRSLISVALDHGSDLRFDHARRQAAAAAVQGAEEAGLAEVSSRDLVAACWPLHPSTLLVLPELCARFGQNERTLFSFLASPEPLSVSTWLTTCEEGELGWVRLDRVYDYFVESASNYLAVSTSTSRWSEISTSIRDAHGLSDAQRRVLKTVGLLNLVSSSGMLRASEAVVAYACSDGSEGTEDSRAVVARLGELEDLGVLTYRDYAHEYRIWQGSDFDINSALRIARRNSQDVSLAQLLSSIRPMEPVVAARHSTRTGTVRAFARTYIDGAHRRVDVPPAASVCDGVLAYLLEDVIPQIDDANGTPVVTVAPETLDDLTGAAVEVAALEEVACDPALRTDDHAARREISERAAHARLHLDRAVAAAFDAHATWTWINPLKGGPLQLAQGVASTRLSNVLDAAYSEGPEKVAYEAINRAQLTSAGARARGLVLGCLADPTRHELPALGLDGDGAEVAVYRAVLEDSGIHDHVGGLSAPHPDTGWAAVWDAALTEIADVEAPVAADHVLNVMMAPPYGVREGTASLLLAALLVVEAANLVIYEHGTFTPHIDEPVLERLVRNPRNFALKHLGTTRRGVRWHIVKELHNALDDRGLDQRPDELTILSTVQRLASIFRAGHSAYTAKTRKFFGPDAVDSEGAVTAAAVRDALAEAREPDVLLFETLPRAVGFPPARARDFGQDAAPEFAGRVAASLKLVSQANDQLALLAFDRATLSSVPLDTAGRELERHQRLGAIESSAAIVQDVETVSQDVRSFMQACLMNPSSPEEFGTQVATTVIGTSPRDWDDHSVLRHLARLEDTARAFRRVADLGRARASFASGDRSFDAYALTMTAADGQTLDATVALVGDDRDDVTAALDTALNELAHLGARGPEALLAALTARAMELAPPRATGSQGLQSEQNREVAK